MSSYYYGMDGYEKNPNNPSRVMQVGLYPSECTYKWIKDSLVWWS